MAHWFVEQLSAKLRIPPRPLSAHSERLIAHHGWPGNVRELQNVIERALVMTSGPTLTIELPEGTAHPSPDESKRSLKVSKTTPAETPGELSLEDYFQRFVLEHQEAMNETELAQKLGISRKCLWERRQRFGIPRTKQKSA